jgi:hypothetical protein
MVFFLLVTTAREISYTVMFGSRVVVVKSYFSLVDPVLCTDDRLDLCIVHVDHRALSLLLPEGLFPPGPWKSSVGVIPANVFSSPLLPWNEDGAQQKT